MCGKGSQTTTQQSQQTQTPNPQAMGVYQDILNQAQNVAATPYQPYGGQLVAPINQQQYSGIANINAYQPAFGTAEGMAYNAAQPITAADIQQYMSPYTQQVVNATEAQFANQNAQQQQQVLGNAVAQGALGGNRVGVAQANLANQQALAQDPVIANLENQGYMTGLNTALTEQQAMAQGAYGVANMAQAGLSGANAQIGAGSLEQQTQQMQDQAAYQQYLAAMGYPFQTTQWLAGIGTGVGSQMGGTTSGYGTTTAPSPSIAGQLAGGLTSGVGLLGASGAFGSAGWLMPALAALAQGGRVNGYADGGGVAGPSFPSVPEDHETLRAQQRQLVRGDRHVQMFPHDTPELPVPSGMKRVESHSGVFHYNPKHVNPSDIHRHTQNGHEHVLLGLGPYSKHDILHRIANGEHPAAIVERNEHGHEVRTALGTHNTAYIQHHHMMRGKSRNHTVHIEHPHKVLSERMRGTANRQSGGGVSNYQLFGGGYGQPMTPYSGGSSFIPGIGLTPGHTMPAGMQPPPSAGNPQQSSMMSPQTMKNFAGLAQTFKGLQKQDTSPGAWSGSGADTNQIGPGVTDSNSNGNVSSTDEGGFENVEDWGSKRGGAVGVVGYQGGGTPDADDTPYQTADLEVGDVGPTGVSGGVPMITSADQHVMKDVPLPTPKPTIEPAVGVVPTRVASNSVDDTLLDRAAIATKQQESGGDYGNVTTTKNRRGEPQSALGAYGIMDFNLPQWSKDALGREVSRDEFLNNPSIQDAIYRHRMGDYINRFGVEGAGRAWLGGEGSLNAPLARDPLGTSVGSYGSKFASLVGNSPEATRYAPLRASGINNQTAVAPQVDRWGSENPIWGALVGAGAGMLASRSPFAGVAIGEGLGAGLTEYQQQRQIRESERLSQARVDNEAQKLSMEADHWQKQYELGLHKQSLEETKPQVYNDPILGPRPIFRDPKNPSRWLFGDTGEPVTGAGGGGPGPAPANIPASDDPNRPFKNVTAPTSGTMMQAQQQGLHGQAMVDAIPQPFRNTAEAVANYQAPLSDFTKMGRAGMSMDRALSIVRQINPDYDQNWYSVRGQGYKNFFSSTSGQSALIQSRNFNTATGHAGELAQALHDLNTTNPGGVEGLLKAAKDSGTPFLSYLAGAAKKNMATGTPEGEAYAKINAVLPFYAAETEKFYAGGPGSETGRQAVQSPFDTSKSYREVMAALYQQKEMYKSKTAPLEAEYRDLFEGGPGQKEYGTNKNMREWHVARDSATKADEVIDRYAKEAGVSRVGVEPGATPPAAPAAPAQPAAPAVNRAAAEQWLQNNPNDPRAPLIRQRLQQMP